MYPFIIYRVCAFRGVAPWSGELGGTPSIVLTVTLCSLLAYRLFKNIKGVRHMNNMINVLIDAVTIMENTILLATVLPA